MKTEAKDRELIAMLEGGPDLRLADVIAFIERAFGPMTADELAEVREILSDLPEQ